MQDEKNIYENNKDNKDKNIEINDISNELDKDSSAESSNADSANLEELLKQKDLKIKELEEKYIRTHADFENIKKRLERDKNQCLEYANENILKDFLPILDTLESALNGISSASISTDSIKNIEDGIKLTIDNFMKALNKNGVTVIDTNDSFNPNLHNAIMQVKDESKEEGQIAQVIQKGYKYKERIIRPSMVSITKNS